MDESLQIAPYAGAHENISPCLKRATGIKRKPSLATRHTNISAISQERHEHHF
jgi:hypothetical protein